MAEKPVKIRQPTIVSTDVVSFASGLDERGVYNATPDSYTYGRNMWVNNANNATKRLALRKWLPDTVGFNSEVGTVYYGGEMLYFIADDGEVRYCKDNDTSWTSCGGSNTITTDPGVITTFLRTNDVLLCMNGTDPLRFVDLATLDVVEFTQITDPSNAPTGSVSGSGLSNSGSYYVYYGVTFNSDGGGETACSPILSYNVNKFRQTWNPDGSEFITVSRNNTAPVGASSWNLYASVSIEGGSPQPSDLILVASNIPISTTSFVDNGSIPFIIDVTSIAPSENSTEGITASRGLMADSTPVLYGDPSNPYTLYFGGTVETGVSFGVNSGAQRLPLFVGTNFYPTSVIGFRNNQGIPSLLGLFSSTNGTARQQTITKKTISYGDDVKTYWAGDELNTGASAVYSPFGVVNHLGRLLFPSSDGIVSINTEAQIQNVLSTSLVSNQISDTYSTIKNAAFDKIVGTAWNNYVFFTIPSRGYNYNNQIAVYDLTNKDRPKWSIWDIQADWLGTVSPPNRDSFVYVRQGNSIFKLTNSYVAEDENSSGLTQPFPLGINTSLLTFANGRNSFKALSQAVVYVANWLGTINIEVSWIDQEGIPGLVTKTFTHGSSERQTMGGWSNPRNVYRSGNNRVIGWSVPIPMSSEGNDGFKRTARLKVELPEPLVNEVMVKITGNLENTTFDIIKINLEGVNVGVIGDIT